VREGPVFNEVSGGVLEYLRAQLSPDVLSTPDALKLTYPGAEDEFRLGLSLYDIEHLRSGGSARPVRLSEDERRFPDLALALHYLVFANRKAAFHSMEAEDELLLLEAVMRAVHSSPGLPYGDLTLRLTLQGLERGEKLALWQSLNCPLQPAVYLTLEPVPLPSARIVRVPAVRQVDVSVGPKKERRDAP